MRQIKFRAWGGATNEYPAKMVYDIESESGFGGECFGDYLEGSSEWKVMQFTGLLDHNSKEIYEGDVVRHAADPKYPSAVIFHRGSFQVGNWPLGSFHEADVKVLGNIYENPELLKP